MFQLEDLILKKTNEFNNGVSRGGTVLAEARIKGIFGNVGIDIG